MHTFISLLVPAVALAVGAGVGFAFGYLQDAALKRNEKLESSGKLKSGWTLMPGSGTRVAFLLIALALIQLVCPMLFTDGTQWWVSGGVVAGYGWMLFKQLRAKRAMLI